MTFPTYKNANASTVQQRNAGILSGESRRWSKLFETHVRREGFEKTLAWAKREVPAAYFKEFMAIYRTMLKHELAPEGLAQGGGSIHIVFNQIDKACNTDKVIDVTPADPAIGPAMPPKDKE